MFYDACKNEHGLPHDPFKSLVLPRPIGWISSLSKTGVRNLAPYSFFNAIGDKPHYVMFASGGRKDSLRNIEETGEFVCNLATYELRNQMNETSASVTADIDEFARAGLTPVASTYVSPPRVGESPVALECRYHQTVNLPALPGAGTHYGVIIGQVVGIYIADEYIVDGIVDVPAMRPIARLGYKDYCSVDTIFSMDRPQT